MLDILTCVYPKDSTFLVRSPAKVKMNSDCHTALGHFFARGLNDYLASGQVLVGCEGNEWILPYVIKQCGAEAFAYASDYPHEVDLVAAREMIHDTIERPDLTHAEKAAVLGGNAKRFFGL